MMTCFLLIFFTLTAYDQLLGASLCISQVLSMYFPFVLIRVL